MQADRLVYMANQIAKFFAPMGEDCAVAEIAGHLKKFWDPRMRAAICRHVAAGAEGVDPLVRLAVSHLDEAKAPSRV